MTDQSDEALADEALADEALADEALAKAVGEKLGMDVPPACVPGVAANVRLLETHIATMRKSAEPSR